MKELFIERREKLLRIALKENNLLSECFIEEERDEPLPGEIYKGVVKNIIPAIKCLFVDIGYEKQGYMTLSNNNKLKKGDDVIVEVIKEQFGDKGAKITNKYTLPGRYVVLTPGKEGIIFSKKISDKDLIKTIKSSIDPIGGIEITIRTNAQFVSVETLKNEINELEDKLYNIEREGKYSLKPKRLYGENSLIHKVLRDNISEDTSRIYVDNENDYSMISNYLAKDEGIDIVIHTEKRSLFDFYGIEKEILALRKNKINLKCGGNIIIEKTEAMYVIDVNSSKNITGKNAEKNAEETNIEAAEEIGRQIRLRNLSGIILVDFIDMKNDSNKKKVSAFLKKSLENDKRKSIIYPFTELNLVQIARRRRGKSIYEYIEEKCSTCNGTGEKLKLSYISLLIKNEILKVEGEGSSINDFYIEINKEYEKDIKENLFYFLKEIDGIDKKIYLNFIDSIEYYKVEPLIFKNQIENVKQYIVTNIEKY
ncbi:Rne/Rng family ribonuclease [Clostridium fallax]|uniref:Ribonuclease G n=1 Tax=Clostridium fallax TaxID=1533 RepID=A0A1M4VAI1_9CLOT|nr:Rne/Rng family ribonuclease [Clostridium fallax]SHE65877.1 ribonuclease G [Clostridium fallax]SQB05816.1 ribonuclease, Rne/Rng family [Clostridium fallax]